MIRNHDRDHRFGHRDEPRQYARVMSSPGFDRRRFLEMSAKASLGVSLAPWLDRSIRAADDAPTTNGGKAKRLIYLFMN